MSLELELVQATEKYNSNLLALSRVNKVNNESSSNIELINDLGFVNSKVVTEQKRIIGQNKGFNEAIRKAVESLLFIKELKDNFGDNILLVNRNDFVSIIRRYDLAVGRFKDYLGVPPDENVQEIKKAKDRITLIKNTKDSNSLLYKSYTIYRTARITDIRMNYKSNRIDDLRKSKLKISTIRYLNAFPLVIFNKDDYSSTSESICNYLGNYLPDSELKKVSNFDYSSFSRDENGLFIVAPSKEIKDSKRGIRIRFAPEPKDPFVCSLSPHGVVIYSKWGKEASDAALEKYKKLFEELGKN